MTVLLAAALTLVLTGPRAPAADAVAAVGSTAVGPVAVLRAARAAYEREPVSERVTLTLHTTEPGRAGGEGGKGATRTESYLLKLDARPARGEAGPRAVLELGRLRVVADRGMLTATHDLAPAAFYRHDYEPPLTERALVEAQMPVPVPALWLLAWDGQPEPAAEGGRGEGGEGGAERPAVLPASVRWPSVTFTHATIDPDRADPDAVLTGVTAAGRAVRATIHVRTARFRTLVVELGPMGGDAGASATLELSFEPLGRPREEAFAPGLDGRALVDSPRRLRPEG